jgi:AcrR family transcriptional regulator
MPRIRAGSIGEHKAITRSQILAAAQELLAETGSADLNLADVAALAGIGRTTIYEYFRDRDDLIASLVEEALPAVIDDLINRVDRDQPASDQLLDLATAVVEFVASDPVLGVILHKEVPRLGSGAQDRIRLAHSDLSVAVLDSYQRAVAFGTFSYFPPDLAGRFIQDAMMSGARAVIAAPHPQQRLKEVTRALREFLAHGLSNQAP